MNPLGMTVLLALSAYDAKRAPQRKEHGDPPMRCHFAPLPEARRPWHWFGQREAARDLGGCRTCRRD